MFDYPRLAALREASPVFYQGGRWFVTRHADVRACLRDRRLARGEVTGEGPFWEVESRSLLWLEPPEHTRLRRQVAAAFTPRAVAALEPFAQELAASLPLDGDFLTDFAQPYSLGVICRLLGVPSEPLFLQWSHAMVKMYELNVSPAQVEQAEQAATDFKGYVLDLLASPRRSLLVQGLVDQGLTSQELVSTLVLLLNAGHEASVNALGNGVWALCQHPAEWERVRHGVSPVEEMLRWDPPLQLFERWIRADGFSLGGVALAQGQKLALLFGSANRDPRVFPDPDRFWVDRANASEHVGFGGGIHACLGAPLARLELEVAMRCLAERLPRLEARQPPRRKPAFVIWGLEGLLLRT